jgi:type I restriction enzyme M protein
MDHGQLNWITGFIWSIADDVLRDVYVRGKYRDVILPMTVIRRFDAVLAPTKQAVLQLSEQLDKEGIPNKHAALCSVSGNAFYNTSKFTLGDLRARSKQQQLKADFEDYLSGFSPNIQEILDKFKFRNQIPTLVEADILGHLIEKFTSYDINLGPEPVYDQEGRVRLPALDNHAMGTLFEELIRRFNEENNEEAGEHFTPRDVVKLMANLMFYPIADDIQDGSYLVYDGACGTGGMLTVAEETLEALAHEHDKEVSIHLYGQEVQPETYAISKADLLIKGEGDLAENMKYGSTLSADAFPTMEFDFMLSNPPYGKSWSSDLDRLGGKKDLIDPRFTVQHQGEELSFVTRTSDGQLVFLVNKLAKMNHSTPLGSRIAEVHNGSALFTGDAGQGESNVRRWVIENDWLEAIIALPLNIFYNTGIATYIWVLTNRKPEDRTGKVQLIDATALSTPLRKNLGKKSCVLSPEQIQQVTDLFLAFEEAGTSKIFPNEAFGYWKITVDCPLRLRSQFTRKKVEALRFASGDEEVRKAIFAEFGDKVYDGIGKLKKGILAFLDDGEEDEPRFPLTDKKKAKLLKPDTWSRDRKLLKAARQLFEALGDEFFPDHNDFILRFDQQAKELGIKPSAAEKKLIQRTMSWVDPEAPPVLGKVHKKGTPADPLHGLYEATVKGQPRTVEYESDTNLRDNEQIPLLEPGGIVAFFEREVLPHVPDAWIDPGKTQKGYEISFTRHFYKPAPLRTLDEIKADLEALQDEAEGLLDAILGEQ